MKSVIIIPARFASTRLPGKVLIKIEGKAIVQWVYERAKQSIANDVFVATDDEKVFDAVSLFGGKCIMTSPSHSSGTDRVHEAVKKACPDADIIINVQGDEPLIPPSLINDLINAMRIMNTDMATVAVPCARNEIGANPNIVKIVTGKDSYALYFSRAQIPFLRDGGSDIKLLRHWGIYAYKREILEKYVSLPESNLEKCEKLEQLRALENGIKIFVLISDKAGIGIDTAEDLEILKDYIGRNKKNS